MLRAPSHTYNHAMTAVDAARRLKHRTYRLSLPLIRRGYELTEPLVRWWHQRFPYRYTPADFGDLFVAHHTEPFDAGSAAAVPRVIYAFWTGDNEMPEVRRRNLDTLVEVNPTIEVRLVTADNLHEHLIPGQPLHPAFSHLSFIHRSDYLRCYMMNFHGGGYADIKAHRNDWSPAFDRLAASDAYVLGYRNPVRWMTPNFADPALQRLMVRTSDQRIGQADFICRPGTPYTREWWRRLNEILDERSEALALDPGSLNRSEDPYAIGFTEILAQIIDPLSVKYHHRLLYDEIIKFDGSVPYV